MVIIEKRHNFLSFEIPSQFQKKRMVVGPTRKAVVWCGVQKENVMEMKIQLYWTDLCRLVDYCRTGLHSLASRFFYSRVCGVYEYMSWELSRVYGIRCQSRLDYLTNCKLTNDSFLCSTYCILIYRFFWHFVYVQAGRQNFP